ncbi:MAG: hypothetical protein KKE44_07970 [Proteobacteria bacterium]|nr:hypothetical protein [Pseudomonadota bacterium]MBU1582664.1 hypothetical protein [Pseudomonadota bacterium]MBU2630424.1 hypothetical protein [Pseudomonadota bacterium]
MQFIVTGYDGKDEGALDRRMAAREAHLAKAKTMYETGRWLYAVAILNDAGKMAGSVIVCDFDSRQALESEWLEKEPYVLGKVWEKIDITRAQVAPFCDKK